MHYMLAFFSSCITGLFFTAILQYSHIFDLFEIKATRTANAGFVAGMLMDPDYITV